jgi:hypothetical protein
MVRSAPLLSPAFLCLAAIGGLRSMAAIPGPTQGLVAYWAFDEGTGSTAADSSGNGYTMSLVNGPAWTAGKLGGALSFNGVNNYALVPSLNLGTNPAVSVSLWLNRTYRVPSNGSTVLFEFSANFNSSTTGFEFFPDDTCSMAVGLHGNAGYNLKCYTQPSSGVWHHLVAVYDKSQNAANEITFYLDGVVQAAGSQPDTADNSNLFGTNPLYLFARGGSQLFAAGTIDDLRIYNRALSAAEVSQLYSLGTGPPDTTPPTVSLTAPLNGAIVSNTVTLSATATDNVAVAAVQFRVDGASVGSPVTSPPYQVSWNTASAANGSHTVSATATDTSDNAATVSASVNVLNPAPAPGLVAHWTFDEGTGSTATDSSGNGYTMSLVNAPAWTTGKLGGALYFNGVNNYAVAPSFNLGTTAAASVALWLNRTYTPLNGASTVLFEFSANFNSSTTGFEFFPDDTCGMAIGLHGNAGYNLKCYAQPSSGVWHHLVAVYDKSQNAANEISFYLDGVVQAAGSQPYTADNSNLFGTNPLYLFARGGSQLFASGTIDDLRIYNRALSAAEVSQLYGQGGAVNLPLSPRLAVLTYSQAQQFTASSTNVTWSVDGSPGGSAGAGTITASGLYSAPAAIGQHVVAAASVANPNQTQSATVFVTHSPGALTYHGDNQRTGQNTNETVLTLANVNTGQFGKLFAYAVDGQVYAQPLYVENLALPGQNTDNVVFVATEHDSVYAFDADGRTASPLWHASFINPAAGITTVPSSDVGTPLITPEIGITSTPVIDPTGNTIYVVAYTKEVSGGVARYVHRLHALDLATGAEKPGGPIVIQGSVRGAGAGSSGGSILFTSRTQLQRSALLLDHGVVYVAFASHFDLNTYHGWLMGYDATTLQLVLIFNDTPNGSEGGIWQSGCGPAADSYGSVYLVAGNGTFDTTFDTNGFTAQGDYGDSFVKISRSGGAFSIADYFTPYNQATISANDDDVGSGGNLLLPDQPGPHPHLMISGGKQGTLYLLDRTAMGHFNPANDNQIVQSLIAATGPIFCTPAVWQNHVYLGASSDFLKEYLLSNGLLSNAPHSSAPVTFAFPGATPIVTSSGTSNGIVWALQYSGSSSSSVLHAYDATNLTRELYNSTQAGSRDNVGAGIKFAVPTVANGRAYVGTQAQLVGYGLLP